MIKLKPIESAKIWGYERWIASTHPNGMQQDFFNAAGGNYPLLVKIIQADDKLSVQVHPDDEMAAKLETPESRGKTECWYVLEAAPDAELVYGLKKDCSRSQLETAVKDGNLEDFLNIAAVHKGDFIFIPSGTVHAIGGGLRLLEVQQSCDITYRLYDWGRGRELQIDKGLQVIRNEKLRKIQPFEDSFSCRYFTLNRIDVKGGWGMYVPGEKNPDSCRLLFVISGSGIIKDCRTKEKFPLQPEEIYAVFPGEKITVEGNVSLMRIQCGADDEE